MVESVILLYPSSVNMENFDKIGAYGRRSISQTGGRGGHWPPGWGWSDTLSKDDSARKSLKSSCAIGKIFYPGILSKSVKCGLIMVFLRNIPTK